MPMYTIEHINSLMEDAVVHNLAGCELFLGIDEATLLVEYNGIGPEFFPAALRAKVTNWLRIFEPAALIHDLRNYLSNGQRYDFNFANTEFYDNCIILVDAAYPWWHWRRYWLRHLARFMYDFVSSAPGWRAWLDCYEKTLSNQNQTPIKEN